MNKLYVGKVVGTHGIKGEIKVLSDINIKSKVFIKDTVLYFNEDNKEYKISSVRFHKGCYLVLLDSYNNINDVLFLNKSKVYVDRDKFLNSDEYVLDDLIGFEVICDNEVVGIIKDYDLNSQYATFLVEGDKKLYIPNVPSFVENIDLDGKKVYTKNVGDLML